MCGASASQVIVRDLGRQPYAQTLALQHQLVEEVADGVAPPTLLLVEHDPVLTMGRGLQRTRAGAPELPAPAGLDVVQVERGGGITYHGPGQLVGYPVVPLPDRNVAGFVRKLEAFVIDICAQFEVRAFARRGLTGVWVGEVGAPRKIASIGVAFRRWVSFHGFALNVDVELDAFARINPCGLDAAVMTSLCRELARPVAVAEVKRVVGDWLRSEA